MCAVEPLTGAITNTKIEVQSVRTKHSVNVPDHFCPPPNVKEVKGQYTRKTIAVCSKGGHERMLYISQ